MSWAGAVGGMRHQSRSRSPSPSGSPDRASRAASRGTTRDGAMSPSRLGRVLGPPMEVASPADEEETPSAEVAPEAPKPSSLGVQVVPAEPAPPPLPPVLETPPQAPPTVPIAQLQQQPPPDAHPDIPIRPHRPAPPKRGILKPPSAPKPGGLFSFRRDIIQAVNTRLVNTAYGVPAAAPNGEEASTSAQEQPAAVGGFWGSALKRLSVAAQAQVGPAAPAPAEASTSALSPPSAVPSPSTPGASQPPPQASTSSSALPVGDLRKVRFRMATLKVVYPINGPNGPLAPWEERATKRRVDLEYRALRDRSRAGGDTRGWSAEDLERLYAECCRTREEKGIERVKKAFRDHAPSAPRALELSSELLTLGAVEALSDLLSVDFGLKKLAVDGCGLDDDSLKPLLNALLVSGSVPTLNLANNKRIRARGWKLIAIFVRRAKFLKYLDLSENAIDRRAADLLVQALAPAPASASETTLKSPTTPTLKKPPSAAFEQHLTPTSPSSNYPENTPHRPAMAGLGIMTPEPDVATSEGGVFARAPVDYDSEEEDMTDGTPLFTDAPLLRSEDALSPGGTPSSGNLVTIRLENCSLRNQALEILAQGLRTSNIKHASLRRNKITALGAVAVAVMIRDYAVPADGSAVAEAPLAGVLVRDPLQQNGLNGGINSVTAREALQAPYRRKSVILDTTLAQSSSQPASATTSPKSAAAVLEEDTDGAPAFFGPDKTSLIAVNAERDAWRSSEARLKLKRQIDDLPRTGSLITLDVKNNDIRNGVVYIAQVLKRNRTLKVLNLSENKIDAQGLASVAEALKYNTTLETLDISKNPCCGPALEGIAGLRAALTINSSLKRLFLNGTDLTSSGAIALAEFLPEAKDLIHLDLTDNFEIDIAGIMALAVAVKMNSSLRCLDVNIQPNDPEFSRLSQEILQSCIRNTELAQEQSLARGSKSAIALPILNSAVARDFKTRQVEDERRAMARKRAAQSQDDILVAADECLSVLSSLENSFDDPGNDLVRDLVVQAHVAEAQVAEVIATTEEPEQKARAIQVSDRLSAMLRKAAPVTRRLSTEAANGIHHADEPVVEPPPVEEYVTPDTAEVPAASPDIVPSAPVEQNARASLPKLTMPEPPVVGVDVLSPRSPLDISSREWVLEEGEVFRKGTALGAADLDDELEDVSGDDLKRNILEAEVDRSPRPPSASPSTSPRHQSPLDSAAVL